MRSATEILEQLRTLYLDAHDDGDRRAAAARFEQWVTAHDAAVAAKVFREAADMLPAGEPAATELEDQGRVEYSMYQRSPVDQTPRRWLKDIAGELAATALQFEQQQAADAGDPDSQS